VAGGFLLALLPPLVLDFGSTADLGLVQSVGGVGLLIGAVVMIVWGGPGRRVPAVLVSGIVFGLGIVLLGLGAAVPLVAAGMFVFAIAQPVINACNAALWQTKVPHELQGRAQGTLRMVAFASVPVSAIVAGALADGVFEPLLRPGGPLAGSIGALIGTGPGRGTALLLIIVGLLPVLAGAAAFLSQPVRNVESERPAPVATRVAETTS
jgi:MFS family permease